MLYMPTFCSGVVYFVIIKYLAQMNTKLFDEGRFPSSLSKSHSLGLL